MLFRTLILIFGVLWLSPLLGQDNNYIRHHADTIFCNLNPYIDSLDTIIHNDTIGFIFGPNKDSVRGIALAQQAGVYIPDSCSILNSYFISYVITKIKPYNVSAGDSLWAELYIDSLDHTPEYISPFKVPLLQSDTPMWYLLWLPTPAFTSPTTIWIAIRWTSQSDSVFTIISHPLNISNTAPVFFHIGDSWIPDSIIYYHPTIAMFKPLIFTVVSEITSIDHTFSARSCPQFIFTLLGKAITPQIPHDASKTYITGSAILITSDSRKLFGSTSHIRCR